MSDRPKGVGGANGVAWSQSVLTTPKGDAGFAARAASDPEQRLRRMFAVNGWVNPVQLLPKELADIDRLRVLGALAEDVNERESGDEIEWFMRDGPRQRLLAQLSDSEIEASVFEARAQGALDQAVAEAIMTVAGLKPALDVEHLDAAGARRLLVARSWLSNASNLASIDFSALEQRLPALARRDEYRKLSGPHFVGRAKERETIGSFLAQPFRRSPYPLQVLRLWGDGGAGKSTLIGACLEAHLRDHPGAALVHLDFDRPDLNPLNTLSLDLELANQLEAGAPAFAPMLASFKREITGIGADLARNELLSSEADYSSPSLEAMTSFTRTLGRGLLAELDRLQQPLIVILDTFERVESAGHRHLMSADRWIRGLGERFAAPDVRLLVSGRNDPAGRDGYRLDTGGREEIVVGLEDFEQAEAILLLKARGTPQAMAEALARDLPGNPLLLTLAAQLCAKDSDALKDIGRELREGRIPEALIQGYLYQRILDHVEDQRARAYVHPGLVLPEITPACIAEILHPALFPGEAPLTQAAANQIFEALSASKWLLRQSSSAGALTQRSDLRRLTLQLMMGDAKERGRIIKIHRRAAAWHADRKSAKNQAMALYHELMLAGLEPADRSLERMFPRVRFHGLESLLLAHIEDFPYSLQLFVRKQVSDEVDIDRAAVEFDDESWRDFMLGRAGRGGEGERIVDADDPLIALEHCRRRPPAPLEPTPTFYVNALCDTGEWKRERLRLDLLVDDLHRLLAERRSERRRLHERLIALTRYGVCADEPISERHLDAYRQVFTRGSAARPNVNICQSAALVEAYTRDDERIIPERYFEAHGQFDHITRVFLIRGARFGEPREWRPRLHSIVTLQNEWVERLWRALGPWVAPGEDDMDLTRRLEETQQLMNKLHGRPLAESERLLRSLRSTISVRWPASEPQDPWVITLLRGQTPELHRAARQALREAFADKLNAVFELMRRFGERLTIRPEEFEPSSFARLAERDPFTWFFLLAQYADRAGVFGPLLDIAGELAPHGKLREVTQAFCRIDERLGAGRVLKWR